MNSRSAKIDLEETEAADKEREQRFAEYIEMMPDEERVIMARVICYLAHRPDRETRDHTKEEMDALYEAAKRLH